MMPSGKFRSSVLFALILIGALLASSCAQNRRTHTKQAPQVRGHLLDNKPSLWISDNSRVRKFRQHYMGTTTVEIGLKKGARYLPYITQVFRREGLPLELAYLPILESFWDPRANSGVARGLWQFTRQTAKHVGMQVGTFSDERLNWRRSTHAAADYLKELGKKFNYDWALALAAYNGGPGTIGRAMRSQNRNDYFQLKLVKETYEYVPRFVAMVQVAKEKFPHLLIAAR